MVFSVKLGVLPRPHLFRRKEMGHENIQTTMVYLDVKPGMKEKAIIETQGKRIRQMPKKWTNGGNKLKDLFG